MALEEPLVQNGSQEEENWQSQEALWDTLEKLEKAGDTSLENKFCAHVKISQDGGLSEIGNKPELWYSSRYISSVVLLLFVVYNLSFLCHQDLPTIFEPQPPYDHFLVSTTIAGKFGFHFGAPQKVLAALELCILLIPLCFAIKHVMVIFCYTGFAKWQAAAHLAWFTIPDLSCFSAIKVLQFVTPQQLLYDVFYLVWYEPPKTKNIKWIIFLIKTPLALIIGLDSFLIKVRLANDMIMDSRLTAHDMIGTIILLNQILGVVQIGKTIRNRLYRFVFAGEDGMMTDKETIRQDVWEAKIAERIFREYKFHKACALMLSWCDDDFQMMCLDDEEDEVDQEAPKIGMNPPPGREDPEGMLCLTRGGKGNATSMGCW
mmetsp:Transcript_53267/g.105895  ORF Transcript_53267/g.105895 Transcript_53267/m.105895 type:complete len:374 (+) Transcript_53267:49-1170(+)